MRTVKGFVVSTLRNLAREHYRSHSRRVKREEEYARQVGPNAAKIDVNGHETHEALFEAIQRLREPYQSTLLLKYFRGKEVREIADAEGVSSSTVRWRLKTAIDELRRTLQSIDDERPTMRLVLIAFLRALNGTWGRSLLLCSIVVVSAATFLESRLSPRPLQEFGTTVEPPSPSPSVSREQSHSDLEASGNQGEGERRQRKEIAHQKEPAIEPLDIDAAGRVWWSDGSGVLVNGRLIPIVVDAPVSDICILPSGRIMAVAGRELLFLDAGGVTARWSSANSILPNARIQCLGHYGSNDGALIGTSSGLVLFDGKPTDIVMDHVSIECLSSLEHLAILGSETGFTVVGSDKAKIESFELEDTAVRTVLCIHSGYAFLGTSRGLFVREPDRPWSSVVSGEPLVGGRIDLLAESSESVWVAGSLGLFRVYDGVVTDSWASFAGLQVTAIEETADGVVWVGTTRGLVKVGGETYTTENSNLPDDHVTALRLTAGGALVVGTAKGIVLSLSPK